MCHQTTEVCEHATLEDLFFKPRRQSEVQHCAVLAAGRVAKNSPGLLFCGVVGVHPVWRTRFENAETDIPVPVEAAFTVPFLNVAHQNPGDAPAGSGSLSRFLYTRLRA